MGGIKKHVFNPSRGDIFILDKQEGWEVKQCTNTPSYPLVPIVKGPLASKEDSRESSEWHSICQWHTGEWGGKSNPLTFPAQVTFMLWFAPA